MVQIESSWKELLSEEFQKPYFKDIRNFILTERKNGKTTFPPSHLLFNSFNLTPFPIVKVVIIGQDPYHGEGQAHGLSFSVPKGIKQPPSLKNIFKELASDVTCNLPNHGNLENWAKHGVLLLNAVLSVNAKEPASHKKAGWEYFTNAVIQKISKEKENVVFLLWGNFAKQKKEFINENKHLVLEAAHPSPFSAHKGFFGCKHFSKTNRYLADHQINTIDWQL